MAKVVLIVVLVSLLNEALLLIVLLSSIVALFCNETLLQAVVKLLFSGSSG